MAKAFYSTPELAELLGVFHSTVRRWIERDEIKGFRVGRNYKIPAAEVMRMLDSHGLPAPDAVAPELFNDENQTSPVSFQREVPGSILQRLLIVDDMEDPALVFRRDTILGTNKPFADMTGYGQIDLIGARLSEVVDGLNGDFLGKCSSGVPSMDKGSRNRSARVRMGDGGLREVDATVDGIEGLQDAHLLIVTGAK